jgi:hypothetical protein
MAGHGSTKSDTHRPAGAEPSRRWRAPSRRATGRGSSLHRLHNVNKLVIGAIPPYLNMGTLLDFDVQTTADGSSWTTRESFDQNTNIVRFYSYDDHSKRADSPLRRRRRPKWNDNERRQEQQRKEALAN